MPLGVVVSGLTGLFPASIGSVLAAGGESGRTIGEEAFLDEVGCICDLAAFLVPRDGLDLSEEGWVDQSLGDSFL